MKWNGIVSQPGERPMAMRFATANTPHASSTGLGRSEAIARMTDGLDRRIGAELLPQTSDAHIDNVRAWIEVVAPHLRQPPFAADHLAGVYDEMVQNMELAVRERGRATPD